MSTTFPPDAPPVSPAGVLASAREIVTGLTDQLWAAKPPEQLLAANAELERLRSTLSAVQAQVATEIDATDAAKTDGWGCASDYLTRVSGGRQGVGRRILRTGQALTTDRGLTWRTLRAGGKSTL